MRADYINSDTLTHILAALTRENELALRVSMATGLRIDDVLHMSARQLRQGRRFTVRERKTGKTRRIYLPESLYSDLLAICGRWYVFEGRNDPRKPRSRQAVWKDLKRAAALFRLPKTLNISPHTCRKQYAADLYKKTGSVDKVQAALNHTEPAVTMLYIMSAAITAQKTANNKNKGKVIQK